MFIEFLDRESHGRDLIVSMLEHEWSFVLRFPAGRCSVVFHKGQWHVDVCGDEFVLSDSLAVLSCSEPVLATLLSELVTRYTSLNGYEWRTPAANVICDAIEPYITSFTCVASIIVSSTKRV